MRGDVAWEGTRRPASDRPRSSDEARSGPCGPWGTTRLLSNCIYDMAADVRITDRGRSQHTMRFVRGTGTVALFLFFGMLIPAYAQQDKQGEKQSRPQEKGAP